MCPQGGAGRHLPPGLEKTCRPGRGSACPSTVTLRKVPDERSCRSPDLRCSFGCTGFFSWVSASRPATRSRPRPHRLMRPRSSASATRPTTSCATRRRRCTGSNGSTWRILSSRPHFTSSAPIHRHRSLLDDRLARTSPARPMRTERFFSCQASLICWRSRHARHQTLIREPRELSLVPRHQRDPLRRDSPPREAGRPCLRGSPQWRAGVAPGRARIAICAHRRRAPLSRGAGHFRGARRSNRLPAH